LRIAAPPPPSSDFAGSAFYDPLPAYHLPITFNQQAHLQSNAFELRSATIRSQFKANSIQRKIPEL
jgi:hypothetical protein